MNKKISSEFAIAVILIVAGTLTYIFWKGSMEISMDNNESIFIVKKNNTASEEDGKWKLFRSEKFGYEFKLPKNWKLIEDDGKFMSEGGAEEISVIVERNKNNYSVEQLLVESLEADSQSIVQSLPTANGIRIEKKEANVLSRTAKILQGNDVITLTYLTSDMRETEMLFDKIVPTFKALN